MAFVKNKIVFSSGSGGTEITVVANYSALPDPTTVSGKFYWCSASQGTSWLPGSLGGIYYNSGMYYSNGTTWEFLNVPYNATQSEVNTGTNNDKFVTPETLKNSTQFQYLDATSSIQTQINSKENKSLSAYSFRLNNTNATANSTTATAKIVGKQTFSTGISFIGTTAPSGTANLSYSWQQIGNMVTLQVSGVYATGGNAITQIIIDLFSDLPNPIKPDGFSGASDRLYVGSGYMSSSTTSPTGIANSTFIRSNSANNGFELVITQDSNSTKAFHLSITYPTA